MLGKGDWVRLSRGRAEHSCFLGSGTVAALSWLGSLLPCQVSPPLIPILTLLKHDTRCGNFWLPQISDALQIYNTTAVYWPYSDSS